jgi:steroid 5-alpha reductase family enzyme
MLNPYVDSGVIVLCYMVVWYVAAQVRRDNSLVDIAWGLGFVLIANWVYVRYNFPRHSLMVWMVNLWGVRLALHLIIRNWGRGEDWRYRQMRENWGDKADIAAFYKVFLLQGALMWVIALPLMQVDSRPPDSSGGIDLIQVLALSVWGFGFFYEALADWQLLRFKADPTNKGIVMKKGLWKYSRHPNYFGEIVLWWGIFLYILPYGVWWLCLLSPLTITWLLVRVSGVPMLESKYKDNPEYQEYVRKTNALIPNIFLKS